MDLKNVEFVSNVCTNGISISFADAFFFFEHSLTQSCTLSQLHSTHLQPNHRQLLIQDASTQDD